MKFAKFVVKFKIPILILAVLLLIPSVIGIATTRINYDMLDYLPEDMETVIGQNELLEGFGKGAFSLIVVENMSDKEVVKLKSKVQKVDHVDTVIWYDTVADISIPKEMLPDDIYSAFNSDNATMMAVFFDTSASSDLTIDAIKEVRKVCGKQCFVSGISALVTDLKIICEKEEPIYVAIAVVMALIAMLLLLDSWLIPIVFLASIGLMILYNMGSNFFFGEISYITKALSAVLQLAVTMDYSIFLWHSYIEQKEKGLEKNDAMAVAVKDTMASVLGSSITTIAGFIALMFMSFTLGKDLGIVMAKGVLLGVIGCVTVLPAMILILDKPLQKSRHKSLIPSVDKLSKSTLKHFPIYICIFLLLVAPALYGYFKTNNEVYFNIGEAMPEDMEFNVANRKLTDNFNMGTSHILLIDSNTDTKEIRKMTKELKEVKGVKYVLGLEAVLGPAVPMEVIPDDLTSIVKNDKWELMMIGSEYRVATDEVSEQINSLNKIVKSHSKTSMVIGEASCTKDMIETTDYDFKVVNIVSVILIFIIIAVVEKSLSLPFILIAVIELGIFINLGLPHYLGQSLPFIAPICISTIELGATVDYAILMTTRYKTERIGGLNRKEAVWTALSKSTPAIIVSGAGLFAATIGVAVYSDIDIISSMCMLLARGAVISVLCVMFILPAFLYLFDKIIVKTTLGMKQIKDIKENENEKNLC
ncbi:MAG: MMPL family transporter [Clostridia bacterium]|nr:MMPL family transporter [Clostridia bacterium]